MALFVLYITLIILISTVYIAENEFRGRIDFDKYQYKLTFPTDGKFEHYNVLRTDSNLPGYIDLKYTKSINRLEVETINIKELDIDCRSIAVEKNEEILGENYYLDTNAYKQFFIDKKQFTVVVDTDHRITTSFTDVPFPYEVIVNDQPLKIGISYTYSDGKISTVVPMGHSEVQINFVSKDSNAPIARFFVEYDYLVPGEPMEFNASISSDDGEIVNYLWDFGDGKHQSGMVIEHKFDGPGQFGVILTVRDNDDLIDSYHRIIYVRDDNNNNLPDDWETFHKITDPDGDADDDDLTNIDEYKYGTNPNNPDTDIDGYLDGYEVQHGADPLDSANTPVETTKKDEGFSLNWQLVAGVSSVIIITFLLITYIFHQNKVNNLERKKQELDSKDNGSKIKKKAPTYSTRKLRTDAIAASKIPKEAMESEKPIKSKPKLPVRKPPKLQDLKIDKQNLNNKMIDTDFKVPLLGTKIVYECPTCESPIDESDEFCQNCGQQFED